MALVIGLTSPAPAFLRITVRDPMTDRILPVAWRASDFPIAYSVQREAPPRLAAAGSSSPAHLAAVQEAFRTWANAGGGSVRFAFDGLTSLATPGMDGRNTVLFSSDARDFSGPTTLATTLFFVEFPSLDEQEARLREADILINANEPFTLTSPTPAFLRDLQAVVTHEVGHLLGFDHSPVDGSPDSEQRATMFPFNRSGQAEERTLAADDLAGLAAVYPPSGAARSGSIAGRVTNLLGRGLFGALVLAWPLDAPDEGAVGTLSGLSLEQPPGSGAYRLDGLATGRYRIEVREVPRGITAAVFLGEQFDMQLARVPAPQFFAGAPEANSALSLEVSGGDMLRGIDVTLGSRSAVAAPQVQIEPGGFLLASPATAELAITTPLGNEVSDLGSFRLLLDDQTLAEGVQSLLQDGAGLEIERRSASFLRAFVALPSLDPGRHDLVVEISDRRGTRRSARATFLVAEAPPSQLGVETRYLAQGEARLELRLPPAYLVAGTLSDREDMPLPGATLRFTPVDAAPAGQGETSPPVAKTNGDGAFALLLPPALYNLELAEPHAAGRLETPRQPLAVAGPTSLHLRLSGSLPPAPPPAPVPDTILVAGTVRDVIGDELPQALVRLTPSSGAGGTAHGATNSLGRFQIVVPPGRYDVAAFPPLTRPPATHPMEHRLFDQRFQENTELRITLPNGFTMSGQVVDSRGLPLPFANLRLAEHFSGEGLLALSADEAGRFSLPLPAGVYDLDIEPLLDSAAGGRAVPHRIERVIHDADTELSITLPDGILLSGRIVDRQGVRAAFAQVTIRRPPAGSSVGSLRADRNGAFSVALAPGSYFFQIDPASSSGASGGAVRTVVPTARYTEDTPLAVTLQDGVLIRGVVRDISALPLPGARLVFSGIIDETPLIASTTAIRDGSFRLLVPRGAYLLSVLPP
ncbi:MAG: matrixin family metalloprotease [Candidatus Tectomicrobia bacterium]|nr:matrixin family metalloprotease [Candidatus Tectomicrobia bacterium]